MEARKVIPSLSTVKHPHREFRDDEFWQAIPEWKNVERAEFADFRWQMKNSIVKIEHVKKVLQNRVSDEFMKDLEDGQAKTPMNIRITPYIFALIDWDDPYNDPHRSCTRGNRHLLPSDP